MNYLLTLKIPTPKVINLLTPSPLKDFQLHHPENYHHSTSSQHLARLSSKDFITLTQGIAWNWNFPVLFVLFLNNLPQGQSNETMKHHFYTSHTIKQGSTALFKMAVFTWRGNPMHNLAAWACSVLMLSSISSRKCIIGIYKMW